MNAGTETVGQTDLNAIHDAMVTLGQAARAAMQELATVPAETKNKALREAAKAIRASRRRCSPPTRRTWRPPRPTVRRGQCSTG